MNFPELHTKNKTLPQKDYAMAADKPVLILSESLDYHGVAVRWGLKKLGVPVDWWERSDFPGKQLISAWISTDESRLAVSGSRVAQSPGRYRTVWNRRGQVPHASDTLNHTDKVVARNESTYLLNGLAEIISNANSPALIVNAFDKAKSANPKAHQLNVAREVGFELPRTLVSNNPSDIRAFFDKNNGRIVAKQHFPFAWRTKQRALLVTGTATVSPDHLHSDLALSACPMIYQEILEVRNEMRIIAFGRTMFALNQVRAGARSQSGFVDIRYEKAEKYAVNVDDSLAALCYAYMDRLGLNYAAFDIAQLMDGSFVFLEANESGQFLFLEDQDPQLTTLDAFCQYLTSGDPLFRYDKPSGLKLSDFEKSEEAKKFYMRYEAHMHGSELTSPFELVE